MQFGRHSSATDDYIIILSRVNGDNDGGVIVYFHSFSKKENGYRVYYMGLTRQKDKNIAIDRKTILNETIAVDFSDIKPLALIKKKKNYDKLFVFYKYY